MPELPEVETIARLLREGQGPIPAILERRILAVHLLWERTLQTPAPDEFRRRLQGEVFCAVNRRGKFLVLQLTQAVMLVHLRMSGDLFIEPGSATPAPHHRLYFELDEGLRLAFNDARKFGRVWLTEDAQTVLADLGPEPLDDSFTAMQLHQGLQARRRQLKPLLLDQTFLAGLGNIYTDEALHRAKLHPAMLSQNLNTEQATGLWDSIRQVLREGIQRNGASIDWVYRGGEFQNHFQVYQRTGRPCPVCGATIQRMVIGQRGTHFCPSCQPLPEGR